MFKLIRFNLRWDGEFAQTFTVFIVFFEIFFKNHMIKKIFYLQLFININYCTNGIVLFEHDIHIIVIAKVHLDIIID